MAESRGEAWCNACERWHPSAVVYRGKCRDHRNAEWRERYAKSPEFRHRVRHRVLMRKRGVGAVPPEGAEILLEDFKNQCAYCGGPPESWDHIVPVSRGGITAPWNVVPACKSCNSRKKDRDLDEFLKSIGGAVHGDVIAERMLLEYVSMPA